MQRVLYVHGLLMTGIESAVLAARLARDGLRIEVFRYGSRREAPDAVAGRLGARLAREPGLHLVAHSFGGMIALAALAQAGDWHGRAVLLGAPLAGGSVAARGLLRRPGGAWLLGAARRWLTMPPPLAAPPGRVAVIAGTRNLGSGRLLGIGAGPGDGVVRLAETQLAGAPRRDFHVNHVELLCNARVAAAVAGFLRRGRFNP